mgnify:CR=1 FL=1
MRRFSPELRVVLAYVGRHAFPAVPMYIRSGGVGPDLTAEGTVDFEVRALRASSFDHLYAVTDVAVIDGADEALVHAAHLDERAQDTDEERAIATGVHIEPVIGEGRPEHGARAHRLRPRDEERPAREPEQPRRDPSPADLEDAPSLPGIFDDPSAH